MANKLTTLKNELTNDPLTRGYAGMDDAAAAADLNTEYRTRDRSRITGADLLDATVQAEYAALAAAERGTWDAMLQMQEINLADTNTRQMIGGVFGGGTTTRANLVALQDETISRAVELGLGYVAQGSVERART